MNTTDAQRDIQRRFVTAMSSHHCTIIRSAVAQKETGANILHYPLWELDYSALTATAIVFTAVFSQDSSITAKHPRLKSREFGPQDLVRVKPGYVTRFAAVETRHIHAKTIILSVIQGIGIFGCTTEEATTEDQYEIHGGDTVIIPVGAPHRFRGKPSVVCMSLEFGYVLDHEHYPV